MAVLFTVAMTGDLVKINLEREKGKESNSSVSASDPEGAADEMYV